MKKFLLRHWNTQKNIFLADVSTEKHQIHSKWFPSFLFSVSLAFLLLIFSSLLVISVGFLFGISITSLHLPISIGLALPVLYLLMRKINVFKKKFILQFLAVCFIVGSSSFLSIKLAESFYDISYDSQWYHLEAVIALNNGWDPFKHRLSPEINSDITSQDILNSYPKAAETIETIIYKSFGKIETAKSLNFIILFMTFGFVLSFFLRINKFSPLLSIISTLLLVMNPITLIQYLSVYLDGSMYNLLLSFIALLLTFYLTHKNYVLFPIVLCLGVLWNVKLTAIIYSTIFCCTFLVFAWYTEQVTLFLKSIQAYIVAACLSVFILGINPYITNTLWYGNPFYSEGRSSSGYIYANAPESLYYVLSLERFVYSIFSRTAILRGEGKTHQLKLPFTYNQDELAVSKYDNTTGGFGPLFSGVFIFSVIGFGFIVVSRHYNFSRKSVIYLLLVIFASSALFPASSYARFIPQFWVFPNIVALYCLHEKKFLHSLVGITLIAIMLGNNFLISREYLVYNWNGTQRVKQELKEIKTFTESNILAVDFDLYRSNRIRFKEAGIPFTEQPISNCMANQWRVLSDYMPESKITLCYQ